MHKHCFAGIALSLTIGTAAAQSTPPVARTGGRPAPVRFAQATPWGTECVEVLRISAGDVFEFDCVLANGETLTLQAARAYDLTGKGFTTLSDQVLGGDADSQRVAGIAATVTGFFTLKTSIPGAPARLFVQWAPSKAVIGRKSVRMATVQR